MKTRTIILKSMKKKTLHKIEKEAILLPLKNLMYPRLINPKILISIKITREILLKIKHNNNGGLPMRNQKIEKVAFLKIIKFIEKNMSEIHLFMKKKIKNNNISNLSSKNLTLVPSITTVKTSNPYKTHKYKAQEINLH